MPVCTIVDGPGAKAGNLWREEKLDIWCRAECHHKRRQGVVLQLSGSLGAKEKAVGNLAASGKRWKL